MHRRRFVATEVEIDVSGIVARTMVKQYFVNPTGDWLEGRYVFPLPENSAGQPDETGRRGPGDRGENAPNARPRAKPMKPPNARAGGQHWTNSTGRISFPTMSPISRPAAESRYNCITANGSTMIAAGSACAFRWSSPPASIRQRDRSEWSTMPVTENGGRHARRPARCPAGNSHTGEGSRHIAPRKPGHPDRQSRCRHGADDRRQHQPQNRH